MKPARAIPHALLFPFCTLLATGPLAAQTTYPVKLNGPVTALGGSVLELPQISPDGSRVVMLADYETEDIFELFSVAVEGGPTVKLNGPLAPFGQVNRDFDISPDGTRVVFRAPPEAPFANHLYSVPITGGEAIQLSPSLPPGGSVMSFRISPDSSRVVYLADQDIDNVFELFSVPLAGGEPPEKLHDPLSGNHDVGDPGSIFPGPFYQITSDSRWVVYLADLDADDIQELFVVPLTGGSSPVRLNDAFSSTADVLDFRLSPDGTRAVFLADPDTDDILELFSVPLDGGDAPVKLSTPVQDGGLFVERYSISPDSTRVAYFTDQDVDNEFELYSVPIDGSDAPLQLADRFTDQGGGPPTAPAISPDSAQVVFRAAEGGGDVVDLYAVPLSGDGGLTRLNPPLVPAGNVLDFRLTPDSSRAVYLADQETDEILELFSVPLDGGESSKLNQMSHAGGLGFYVFEICPAGDRIVYATDQDSANVLELYSVPVAGGSPPVKLNPALVGEDGIAGWRCSPNGRDLIYVADQETARVQEHYRVPVAGGNAEKIGATTAVHGDVHSNYQVSPDGQWMVYFADHETDEVVELFSVPASGGPVVKLNRPLAAGGDVGGNLLGAEVRISPDSSRVVYAADQDTNDVVELFTVPIQGGTPVKLSGALPLGESVFDFEIAPDNSRVVYRAGDIDQLELYSVPLTGGAAPLKLNDPVTTGAGVLRFVFTPDGSRAVYEAGQTAGQSNQVFSVAAAGGQAPIQLSGPLVAGGFLIEFLVSPDGSRLVYWASQDTPDQFELYSAPVGGGSPVKLNSPLAPRGDVLNRFRISADSSRVVYRAALDDPAPIDLFSVPITGGTATKLNPPLPVGRNVVGVEISPDNTRAVYVADQDTDNVFELYSVLLAGGPSVKLTPPLVPGGSLAAFPPHFQISPDGSHVVYTADQETNNILEIFSVALTGGPAVKLNGPIPPGQFFTGFDFQISPHGSRLAYWGYQDTDLAPELYVVPLVGGPPVKVHPPLAPGRNVQRDFRFGPRGSRLFFLSDLERQRVTELYTWKRQAVWEGTDGIWSESQNWRGGVVPDSFTETIIARPANVTITGDEAAELLYLGGAGAPSEVALDEDATLVLGCGAELSSGAILGGDGVVDLGSLPLTVPAGAALTAGADEFFILSSGPVTNAGRIDALSGPSPPAPADMEFSGAVTNLAGAGEITMDTAALRFAQGLCNEHILRVLDGNSQLEGELLNTPSGTVTIQGDATARFSGRVTNEGSIATTNAGGFDSTAVFQSALAGNGVGGAGAVVVEGAVLPGFGPATMAFGGDLTFGPAAALEIEIGGTDPGASHDHLDVAGHLILDGTATVSLINSFVPEPGNVFDVWDATSSSGIFAGVNLPPLPPGRFWHHTEVNTNGNLRVGCVPDSYAAFATFHSVSGGPDADPDRDRLSNLIEYVLAFDPNLFDPPFTLPTVSHAGENDLFEFTMASPLGPDVTHVIETSTDLANWIPLATRSPDGSWSGPVTLTAAAPGKVRVTLTSPTTPPRRFYRLAITLAP